MRRSGESVASCWGGLKGVSGWLLWLAAYIASGQRPHAMLHKSAGISHSAADMHSLTEPLHCSPSAPVTPQKLRPAGWRARVQAGLACLTGWQRDISSSGALLRARHTADLRVAW